MRKRGIILITTLIIMVVLTMILTAAVVLIQGSDAARGSLRDQEAAVAAAQSGLDYALTRLQADPNWIGDGNGPILSTPELYVEEDQGNVIGILTSTTGEKSLFLIRFNYQNGAGEPDEGLPDPARSHFVANPYVSVNNLANSSSLPVPRSAEGGRWAVSKTTPVPYECPRYTACVLVEGRAGDGLRELDRTNLDPVSGNRRVASVVLEAYLGKDVSNYGDAAVYSAQNIEAVLDDGGEFLVESLDSGTPPRARALGNMSVSSPSNTADFTMDNGEVFVGPLTGIFQVNGAPSVSPVGIQEDSSDKFLRLKWSEIDKASPGDAQMKAGLYVWRDEGAGPRLYYYQTDYTGPASIPPAGTPPQAVYSAAGSLDGGAGAIELDANRLRLTLGKNVYVAPQAGVTSLTVVPDPALLASTRRRPEVKLEIPSGGTNAPVLTSTGNVHLEGELSGIGSVTSEGNVTFQGSSVLQADPEQAVAVYARGDITLRNIPDEVIDAVVGGGGGGGKAAPPPPPGWFKGKPPTFGPPGYEDVAFSGVLYSLGDFNAELRSARYDSDLLVQGVLVAYGGDPEAEEAPGAVPGAGQVRLYSDNVQLIYDSSYVAALRDTDVATALSTRMWHRY